MAADDQVHIDGGGGATLCGIRWDIIEDEHESQASQLETIDWTITVVGADKVDELRRGDVCDGCLAARG